MNETTIVRAIGEEDQSVWQPLWAQYLAFYGTEVSDAVYTSTFQRIPAGNNGDIREFRGALACITAKPWAGALFVPPPQLENRRRLLPARPLRISGCQRIRIGPPLD